MHHSMFTNHPMYLYQLIYYNISKFYNSSESNFSKLVDDDILIFKSLIKSLFPGLDCSPVIDQEFVDVITKILKEENLILLDIQVFTLINLVIVHTHYIYFLPIYNKG